jgi:hypothetical protein
MYKKGKHKEKFKKGKGQRNPFEQDMRREGDM